MSITLSVVAFTFGEAIEHARELLREAPVVSTRRWQGVEISGKPELATHEVRNFCFTKPFVDTHINALREDIKPNLPWADDHFTERVGGQPLNPGEQWKHWPYGNSANRFRDDVGQFNHSYMERFWPKYAGKFDGGILPSAATLRGVIINRGIRQGYGDLIDVVKLLVEDPYTRQAYVPIYFPEDTGGGDRRAPCTLGYHLLMREDRLHMTYYIRSCDFVRHFRDDIYLAVRLQRWMLEQCQDRSPRWIDVNMGDFTMFINSLHMFRNDHVQMFQGVPE